MKKVVIIGGGFGGVRLARLLARKHAQVTLVNDSPDFRYSPALYRAATGKKMASARLPLDWMLLDAPSVNIKIDKAVSIDATKHEITLASGEKVLTYDYASFALGSITTYFNIEGLHEHAYGIKSADEIKRLRVSSS
jgi:NADH:ubiquinone reductase (H+-translocating)